MALILLISILILYFIYKFLTKNLHYWKNKGVPFIKPLPLLGNCSDLAFLRQSAPDWIKKCCLKYKNEPFFGIWLFMEPALVALSPDLIKRIFIKDFNVFPNRGLHYAPHIDPIFCESLMFLRTPMWKPVRQKMNPSFNLTKAKRTLKLMDDCASQLKDYIHVKLKENSLRRKDGYMNVYGITKDYITKVTVSIFFGLEAECFTSENCIFKKISQKMYGFSLSIVFRSFAYFFCPPLVEMFKLHFYSKGISEEIESLIKYSIEEREKSGKQRGDFIDAAIELKNQISQETSKDGKSLKLEDDTLTETRILAQPAIYFAAAFVATRTSLSFALHELSLNPDLQNKVREEILENVKKYGGCNYEAIQNMRLLDAVYLETMRKYPTTPFLDRISVEEYKIPGTDIILEKGTRVIIPTMHIHYNPEYYPNPEKFDPYRFIGENKNFLNETNYIPFGSGPRFCIGKQYGQLIGKMGLIHILSEFQLEKCPQTNDPVKFEIKSYFVESSNRFPMYIKKIIK